MSKIKKIIVTLLIFQAFLAPHLKAFACKKTIDRYRASQVGKHRFPWEIVAMGSVYSSTAAEVALTDVIRDIPKLNTFGEISKFQEKAFFSNNDLNNYLLSQSMANPLFKDAVLVSSKEEGPEKNVLMFKPKVSKSNITVEEKTVLIENPDIKTNALHLHYIKIPDELLKSKQKFVAETVLIYNNPDEKTNLDFSLMKNSRLRNLEGKMSRLNNKKSELTQKSHLCTMQKEFKISPCEKSMVLAVYSPQPKSSKKLEKIPACCGKYIALVRFKTVSN